MRESTLPSAATAETEALRPTDPPDECARLIRQLDRLGLRSSARLLADSLQPVRWLGAQALWLVQPVGALAGAGEQVARWARTLESDAEYAALLTALDSAPPEEPA